VLPKALLSLEPRNTTSSRTEAAITEIGFNSGGFVYYETNIERLFLIVKEYLTSVLRQEGGAGDARWQVKSLLMAHSSHRSGGIDFAALSARGATDAVDDNARVSSGKTVIRVCPNTVFATDAAYGRPRGLFLKGNLFRCEGLPSAVWD
jgi:hypothetical protein